VALKRVNDKVKNKKYGTFFSPDGEEGPTPPNVAWLVGWLIGV